MTEDDAKTKWCPMARYERDLVNRSSPHPQNMNCIGSACMAWRTEDIEMYCADLDRPEDGDDVATEIVKTGYCGLAGKP